MSQSAQVIELFPLKCTTYGTPATAVTARGSWSTCREQVNMTDGIRMPEMACARPTKKHPDGRTGTTAGYQAHRESRQAPCSECSEAWAQDQALRRGPDYREYRQALRDNTAPAPAPVPGNACEKNPDRKYAGVPIGIRTGTIAGYTAHKKAGEEPCDACKQANSAKTALRRGADPDDYAAYRQSLREYEERLRSGVPVPVCAKPTPEHPSGRTGSAAGWQAHYYADDPPCEPCVKGNAADTAQRKIDDPELSLRGNLYSHYRLPLERFKGKLVEQDNRCAICRSESPEDIRLSRFHVDHDHSCCPGFGSCGKCVRGLLCRACNTALGNFQDDPNILLAAIRYLLSYGKELAEPMEAWILNYQNREAS